MAEITPARRRRALFAGSAVLVAGAVVVAVAVAVAGSGHDAAAAKLVGTPGTKSSSPHGTTGAARVRAPTTRPTTVRVPHEVVAAEAPTSFTYRAPKYRINAHVCGMEYIRPLDPPGEQHHTVCWVQHDFGFAPGSRGRGTTYVLGHSWAEDRLEVLNKISETAMQQVLPMIAKHRTRMVSGIATYPVTRLDGDLVTLRTPTGRLTYTVRDAYAVAKTEAGYVRPLMNEHTRNRVVIITCGELHGVDYDYNIIVDAFLTSSKATTSRT